MDYLSLPYILMKDSIQIYNSVKWMCILDDRSKTDAYKLAWMVMIFVFTLSHGQS